VLQPGLPIAQGPFQEVDLFPEPVAIHRPMPVGAWPVCAL
jgi:hypothetical protein